MLLNFNQLQVMLFYFSNVFNGTQTELRLFFHFTIKNIFLFLICYKIPFRLQITPW